MLLGGSVLLVAAGPLVRRSRTLGDRLTAGGRAAHAAMTEFLSGLKLAKSDATEARHVRDFTGALRDMRRQQLDFTRTSAAARAIFNIGAAVALAALVGISAGRAGLNAPELLVMAFIAVRVLPALLRLQQDAQQFAHVLPAWLHARTIEDSLRDAAEPPADPEAPLVPLRRELTVRGVTFSYQKPSDFRRAGAGGAGAGRAGAGRSRPRHSGASPGGRHGAVRCGQDHPSGSAAGPDRAGRGRDPRGRRAAGGRGAPPLAWLGRLPATGPASLSRDAPHEPAPRAARRDGGGALAGAPAGGGRRFS